MWPLLLVVACRTWREQRSTSDTPRGWTPWSQLHSPAYLLISPRLEIYSHVQKKWPIRGHRACAEHVVTGVTKCVRRINMKCDRNRRREEGNGVKSKTPLCSSRSHLFCVCVSLVCAWLDLHIFSITPLFMFHMVTTYPIWLSFILPHFCWTSLLRISRVFRCDSVPLWNYQEYYACASVGLSSCRPAEYHAGLETDI